MALSTVLFVLFVLCAGQLVAAQRSLLTANKDCSSIRSQKECYKSRECAWCSGASKTGCVSAVASKYIIDAKIGQCKGAAIPAKASSACDSLNARSSCTSNRSPLCAYCVVPSTGAGGCVPDQAAQFLSTYSKDCTGPGNNKHKPSKGSKHGDDDDDDCDDCDDDEHGKGKGPSKGKKNSKKDDDKGRGRGNGKGNKH